MTWDAERLANASYLMQYTLTRQEWRIDSDDPVVGVVATALIAGQIVMERALELPDPEHVACLIDSLDPDHLRLLAFERIWAEERRLLGIPYWSPLP
jgi:hypothetical protein